MSKVKFCGANWSDLFQRSNFKLLFTCILMGALFGGVCPQAKPFSKQDDWVGFLFRLVIYFGLPNTEI